MLAASLQLLLKLREVLPQHARSPWPQRQLQSDFPSSCSTAQLKQRRQQHQNLGQTLLLLLRWRLLELLSAFCGSAFPGHLRVKIRRSGKLTHQSHLQLAMRSEEQRQHLHDQLLLQKKCWAAEQRVLMLLSRHVQLPLSQSARWTSAQPSLLRCF